MKTAVRLRVATAVWAVARSGMRRATRPSPPWRTAQTGGIFERVRQRALGVLQGLRNFRRASAFAFIRVYSRLFIFSGLRVSFWRVRQRALGVLQGLRNFRRASAFAFIRVYSRLFIFSGLRVSFWRAGYPVQGTAPYP